MNDALNKIKYDLMNEKGITVDDYNNEPNPFVGIYFEHLSKIIERHTTPKIVWHKPIKLASNNKQFLAEWISTNGESVFTIWRFPYDCYDNVRKAWAVFIEEYNIKRYVYLEDILQTINENQ